MSRYISQEIRLLVAERADFRCEYCLIHEDDSYLSFQIDHIISIKHGGDDNLDNLAHSCVSCNRAKGSDIGSVLLPDRDFIRLFNPRTDTWENHFKILGAEIIPLSAVGKVTIKILGLNNELRLVEREALIEIGRFPAKNDQ